MPAPELQIRTVDVDGIERTFWLPDVRRRAPAPLLIAFHGRGATGPKLASASGLDVAARDAGFNIVFPDALERVWDDHGVGRRDGSDDDRFLVALLDYLRRREEIGAAPPFLIGVENGACFVERLGREGVHDLAGAALIGGTAREASRKLTPRPRRALPLLIAAPERPPRERVGVRNRLALRDTADHRQLDHATLLADWQPINQAAGTAVEHVPAPRPTATWPARDAGRQLTETVIAFAAVSFRGTS